jgi:hypothetical protein
MHRLYQAGTGDVKQVRQLRNGNTLVPSFLNKSRTTSLCAFPHSIPRLYLSLSLTTTYFSVPHAHLPQLDATSST